MVGSNPGSVHRILVTDLDVDGEDHLTHVAVYASLRRWLVAREARFAILAGALAPEDDARLLNLAFWQPSGEGAVAEILPEPFLTADQLAHNAWHQALAHHLGPAASAPRGLLFIESVASAFDIYLVGRLLGHHPDAEVLVSQVPAMRSAAEAAGLDDEGFEALLAAAHDDPEASFEELRALLYDTSCALLAASNPDDAALALAAVKERPLAPLLHHYELPTWLLYARAYGDRDADEGPVTALDQGLREAEDPIAWLESRCLG